MPTIRTLMGRLREFKKPAILTPLFIIGEVILECLIPLTMVSLVDALDGDSLSPVVRLGAILIGYAFASLACGILAARFAATASVGLAKNLRQDLFFKVQDFSFADIDRFSTSLPGYPHDHGRHQRAKRLRHAHSYRGARALMIVFSIVMAWRINVQMALIFLGMVPVLAIILAAIVLVAFPIFRRIFKKYDALNNSVQENVAAIRVVKSFVTEEHETTKFRAASQDVRKDFTNAEKLIALNSPVMMFFIFAAIIAVDYVGASIIVNSGGTELTKGGLTALITSVSRSSRTCSCSPSSSSWRRWPQSPRTVSPRSSPTTRRSPPRPMAPPRSRTAPSSSRVCPSSTPRAPKRTRCPISTCASNPARRSASWAAPAQPRPRSSS